MAHSRSSSYPYKTQNTMNDTFFFFNDTATTEIYTLSLHDALPILIAVRHRNAMPNLEWIELAARLGSAVLAGAILGVNRDLHRDRKSTSLNSSHSQISYAVFCLKKKINTPTHILHRKFTLLQVSAL